jgi:hypothetical protein
MEDFRDLDGFLSCLESALEAGFLAVWVMGSWKVAGGR